MHLQQPMKLVILFPDQKVVCLERDAAHCTLVLPGIMVKWYEFVQDKKIKLV